MQKGSGIKRLRTADSGESSQGADQSHDRGLITFKSPIPQGSTYIRTRHNNLRCFPSCAPTHKQNAFCGSQIYINVKRTEINTGKENKIFGGFHKAGIPADETWKLDQPFNVEEVSSEIGSALLQARKYREDEEFLYFIFMPDGKWTYAATLIESDLHYFTIFLVVNDALIDVKHSEAFHVIPTWKVPSGGEPGGAALSIRKSISSTSQSGLEEPSTTTSSSNSEQESGGSSSDTTPGVPLRSLSESSVLTGGGEPPPRILQRLQERQRQAMAAAAAGTTLEAMPSSVSTSSSASSGLVNTNNPVPLRTMNVLGANRFVQQPPPPGFRHLQPDYPQGPASIFVRQPSVPQQPRTGFTVNPGGLVLSSANAGLLNPPIYAMSQRAAQPGIVMPQPVHVVSSSSSYPMDMMTQQQQQQQHQPSIVFAGPPASMFQPSVPPPTATPISMQGPPANRTQSIGGFTLANNPGAFVSSQPSPQFSPAPTHFMSATSSPAPYPGASGYFRPLSSLGPNPVPPAWSQQQQYQQQAQQQQWQQQQAQQQPQQQPPRFPPPSQ